MNIKSYVLDIKFYSIEKAKVVTNVVNRSLVDKTVELFVICLIMSYLDLFYFYPEPSSSFT